jgi:hypothetical protein
LAITLGKDCSISVGGAVVGVRDVQLSAAARTIEVEEYGSRYVAVYQTGFSETVTIELNDNASVSGLVAHLTAGTAFTVSGGQGGWNFPAVVTGLSESNPLDGVATLTITAQRTKLGWRT